MSTDGGKDPAINDGTDSGEDKNQPTNTRRSRSVAASKSGNAGKAVKNVKADGTEKKRKTRSAAKDVKKESDSKILKAAMGRKNKSAAPENINFRAPEYYTNRELSWIQFNERVLSEARDKDLPLFERVKMLGITASNLDEFFMVRVASLKDMVHAGYKKPDIAGMTPGEQLSAISTATHGLVNNQYSTWNRSLLPQLKQNGITVYMDHGSLNQEQGAYVDRYFIDNVYPVLTPMAVDSSRPFPLIRNKSLNIGSLLTAKDGKGAGLGKSKKKASKKGTDFALVQVPDVLPRLVQIPPEDDGDAFILLEEIIKRNIDKLFLNYSVQCAHAFRVMRNADLSIDEDEAEDLLKEIEKQLKKRQWGEAIRLEVEDHADPELLKVIKEELQIEDHDIFYINGPIDLTFLSKIAGMDGYEELKIKSWTPQPPKYMDPDANIFSEIRKGDILLEHPYETFDPVVNFIRTASKDKDVLAIKMTLYRVSGNSPIIAALAQAAENGKQVSVLVELKARFDEEHNINWAKTLEKAGCHVIYGLVGLKTHSKIALVVRREEDGIRRYVHLGTGNYNDTTARFYTDMGMFTCSEPIGEDATAVFNMLSGYSEPVSWNKLSLAPLWLKDRFLYLIGREAEHARDGREARIVAKMNSVCDPDIIEALYKASAAGVKIDLIVRGICTLKVGIPGVSDNITVRSIVGFFLEHSRIFWFLNEGNEEIYMGSADWMPRNLERRVEILFPVERPELKEDLKYFLNMELNDNLKAHIMQPDGVYLKLDRRGKKPLNSQKQFCIDAKERAQKGKEKGTGRVFIPETPPKDDEESSNI
ncbi:MAG: RNA degradosome polyphosphate kinase [Lachnospiraceae bacterium]|nr:RNA degradosome polyphosphate kinase [Lachnospiraceae bacterium]